MGTATQTKTGTVEHARAADFLTVKPQNDGTEADADQFMREADEYFHTFAKPTFNDRKEMLCLKCGEPLTGLFSALLGKGGFEWGLAHGEGHCRNCSWPARGMHYAQRADGKGELFTARNFVLQYHPDFVTEKPKRGRVKDLLKPSDIDDDEHCGIGEP